MPSPHHGNPSLVVHAPVARVVVFSELSPRAKTQYARFLVENNVQFAKRPSDGRYVANVHLIMPPLIKDPPVASSEKQVRQSVSPGPLQLIETRSACLSVNEAIDTETFTNQNEDEGNEAIGDGNPSVQRQRFSAFLAQFGSSVLSRQCSGTYSIESKLLRLMSDIYDARTDEFTCRADESDCQTQLPPFASYVSRYLKKRFGLKTLVEQQALELVEGLAIHSARLDVDLFSRFLEGEWDEATLSFFLQTREAAQQELSAAALLFRPTSAASARRRGGDFKSRRRRQSSATMVISPETWLSKQQIERVAQKVFGSKGDDNFLQFVHNVRSFVVENPTTRSMEKLLTLNELLTVAVETFLTSQPSPSCAQSVSLSSTSKHAHDGQHDLDDSCCSPSPSPLPPPPLPRTFGSTTSIAPKQPSRGLQSTDEAPSTRATQSTRAVLDMASFHAGSNTEKPKKPQCDEVESRLSSLLARMQQRQLQGSL